MSELKYKVGDRVRIKSIDWYNENKDKVGNILYKRNGSVYPVFFSKYMSNFCGEILTIKSVFKHSYHMNETSSCEFWTDEMIECKVEEETKPKFKVGDKIKLKSTLLTDIFGVIGYEPEGYRITNISNGLTYFMSYSIEHYYELVEEEVGLVDKLSSRWINEFNLPNGYIFKDENGNEILTSKIILEKKKPKYPKTYAECCRVLGVSEFEYNHTGTKMWYRHKLMATLDNLMLCRDAYWKLYGEEMGLGKPWEPNWTSFEGYPAIYMYRYQITLSVAKDEHHFLAFSTAEMRDAFYENFKEEIEQCKELL